MKTFNLLILGSGGREHALAWKMSESEQCGNLFIAPGNAGTELHGKNVDISPNDFEKLADFALTNDIAMIVVGPEEPLVLGVVDYFQNDPRLRHIRMVGPTADGAQLEGSKAFAKAFMQEFGIPTAAYREFNGENLQAGLDYLAGIEGPYVLKADGLAAGKGVVICDNLHEAQTELREMLGGKFGNASATVVIEQFLSGIEFSVFAITDGAHYQLLPIAKDYKRIGEGDTGLNTGGMGAVSPLPFVDAELLQKVEERIVKPTIAGIRARNMGYRGFVFFGLINCGGDPYVIEYNCRMGDPETEVVIPRLRTDLVALCESLFDGTIATLTPEFDPRTAATIMLVAGGYPGSYPKGQTVTGLDAVQGSIVFHAGTKIDTNGNIITNGGRLLAVTTFADSHDEALAIGRQNAERIQYDGKYYRTDIGFDL